MADTAKISKCSWDGDHWRGALETCTPTFPQGALCESFIPTSPSLIGPQHINNWKTKGKKASACQFIRQQKVVEQYPRVGACMILFRERGNIADCVGKLAYGQLHMSLKLDSMYSYHPMMH